MTNEESLGGRLKADGEMSTLTRDSKWTEAGFETIFSQNYERVVSVLFRLVGNRAQAEELANEVFWKLYRQSFASNRQHSLCGWLYRTATRLGIDALRSAVRRKRYEATAEPRMPHRELSINPLSQVLRDEKRRHVSTTLARLKPAQAQILILRNSGFSYKELAEVLGVRPSSIGTLLARAEAEFEKRYLQLHGDKE